MCVAAAAAISAVAGIAQAAVGYAGAQQDYANKATAWRQNYVNTLAAGRNDMKQYQLRQIQEQDKAVQEDTIQRVEMAEKIAETQASTTSSGLSVQNLVAGVRRQGLRNRSTIAQNYQMTVRQIQAQAEAVPTEELNRINSVERPVSPNPLAYAIQAVSSGVRAFS